MNRSCVIVFFIHLFAFSSNGQDTKLDIDGDVKIRGAVNINAWPHASSVFIGERAGLNSVNIVRSVFVGVNAGRNATDGFQNTFVGESAGLNNTSGSHNSFFGHSAGYANTIGGSNSFYGDFSGEGNTDGSKNSFFGGASGQLNTQGEDNSFFGYGVGTENITGDKNTAIGAQADFETDDLDRAIAIGYSAIVGCGNCAAIGGTGINAVNVGINNSSPQTRLHVVGDELRISAESDVNRFIQFRTSGSQLDLDTNGGNLYINSGSTVSMGHGTTQVGIGTDVPGYKFQVGVQGDGTEARANAWNIFSDRRWKKDLESIDQPIEKLKGITGYFYRWKEGEDTSRQVGVIAQEVEKVLPEAVTMDNNGYKSVDYGKLTTILFEAGKRQQDIIDQQQKDIDILKSELDRIKSMMEASILTVSEE